MLAMLWASRILNKETIEEAKEMYAKVPRLLKDDVKEILIEAGRKDITQ